MNNKPIGVIDSGIGGLSVLAKLIQYLPDEEYIYYADKDNVPYGIKSNEEIIECANKIIDFLITKEVKAVVIACNTITSVAIEELRKNYKIPIIGIEPAVKLALDENKDNRVLVMATPVTIRGKKLQELLNKYDTFNKVDLLEMPELVIFAENEDFSSKEVYNYINSRIDSYDINNYDFLVLGCTHFLFFRKTLSKIFPNDCIIIDGSIGVSKMLKKILIDNNLIGNNNLNIKYYYSDLEVNDELELNKLDKLLNINK